MTLNGHGVRHESHIAIDGAKLLTELNKRGLSSAQFAKIAGVSPTTVSGIMTKARGQAITVRSARRIGEALAKTPLLPELAAILADDQ
jgi:transcriptional regulator with XRE-family HTH domain